MGRLLAIDYGTRRVGLALSDPLKMIASPYRTIINKGNSNLIVEIERRTDYYRFTTWHGWADNRTNEEGRRICR